MSSILCGITFCSDSRNKHTNQQQTQPKHENNIRPNYNDSTSINIPIDRTDQTSNIISNNNIIKSYPYNHWVQNNILNPPLKKPNRPPPKITRRKTRVGIILLFETNEFDAKGEASDSDKNVQHRHTNPPSHTKTNTYSINSEYKYRQYRTRSTKYNNNNNNKRQSYNSNNSHNTFHSRSYLHRRNSYYQSQDQLSQLSETNLYSRYRRSSTSSMIVENTHTDESSMEFDEKLILERIWEGNDTSESSFTFTGEKSPTYVCLTR
eukprot:773552_1